jgi:HEAT repeat protein
MPRMLHLSVWIGMTFWASHLSAVQPEPRYKGKPLAYWVERIQTADTDAEQLRAAEAIKAFGAEARPALPKLIEMLDDRSPEFRKMVKDVLCTLGPEAKPILPELVKLLKAKRARDPQVVIAVIGSIGPDAKEAAPALIEALADRRVQDEAIEALCAIGPSAKDALPAIRRAIREAGKHDDERTAPSFVLIDPLYKLGPDAVPLLIEFLDDDDPNYKSRSAHGLGRIGPAAKSALAKLVSALKHDDPAVRGDAAVALWRIDKNTAGVPVLAALLSAKDRVIAEPAAQALGEIGPDAKEALPALAKALTEETVPFEVLRDVIRKIEGKKQKDH